MPSPKRKVKENENFDKKICTFRKIGKPSGVLRVIFVLNMSDIKLTSFSKGSGCGCKIQPAVLETLLHGLKWTGNSSNSASDSQIVLEQTLPNIIQLTQNDGTISEQSAFQNSTSRVILGNSMNDDCSVFDLKNGEYLLQTVDFFTPMVNDAHVFGLAAAANALSDIYAMGGRPIMANAVFGWPVDELPIELAREVLKGGKEMCDQLGVPLVGGHTIDSNEPLFGLSVTGLVPSSHLKTNSGARAGDCILISKPLGIGMLAAGHKRGLNSPEQDQALLSWLVKANDFGQKIAHLSSVHAMTDVTGFGLIGHLLEVLKGSEISADIDAASIPTIEAARSLAQQFVLPDNAMRNWNAYEKQVELVAPDAFPWLVDPQTNGGLLIFVDENSLHEVMQLAADSDCTLYKIGKAVDQRSTAQTIIVK